jgi:hypothetical protein
MDRIENLDSGTLLKVKSGHRLYLPDIDYLSGETNETLKQGEIVVFLKSIVSFRDITISPDILYKLEVIKPPSIKKYHLLIWTSTFEREIEII